MAEAQEQDRKAAWDRLAEYLRHTSAAGTPCILDVRSQRTVLEHVKALEGHVASLAAQVMHLCAEDKAEARAFEAERRLQVALQDKAGVERQLAAALNDCAILALRCEDMAGRLEDMREMLAEEGERGGCVLNLGDRVL